MLRSIGRAAILGWLLGLGAAALWTLHTWLRGGFDTQDWNFVLEQTVLVATLTGLSCFAVTAGAARHARKVAQHLAAQLATFRDNPASFAIPALPEPLRKEVVLVDLFEQVRGLCTLYRRVLADCVVHKQMVESLKLRLNGTDSLKSPRLTVAQRTSGSSRNMVARLTPNLHWMTATPALQHLLARPSADLNGRPFTEAIHPGDVKTVQNSFAEALQTGEGHNLAVRLLVGQGKQRQERHVLVDVLTQYTDEGAPIHFRCHFLDVTDRVRAERELLRRTDELSQANEQLRRINRDLDLLKESYRDLYHNAPVLYFSLDAAGKMNGLNDTLLHALGYSREDLFRQPYSRLLAAESRDGFLQNPGLYQKAGQVETQWLKHDGTIIDVWIRTEPVHDADGHFVRSRSAAQDVTDRKRLDRELRGRQDELEHANEQLRRINRELNAFTYAASHELKEPLNTLEAISKELAEHTSRLGADVNMCITHLLTTTGRLSRRIDDFLRLARVGRVVQAPQPFALASAVAPVRRDLGDLLQRKDASFNAENSLPAVLGDPERITQLLMNLVSNGLKYNRHPKPVVDLGQVPTEGEWVTLFVRDNGIGIDPKHHDTIFDLFQRLHQSDEFEGSGAGLAMCKSIVEAHGGSIWVKSAVGHGATFYFTLPRASDTHTPALPPTNGALEKRRNGLARPIPRPDQAAVGVKARLLLVEDTIEIGELVKRVTHRAGHPLHWETTAEAAWESLQQQRPDLVLVDRRLPGMDGIELIRKLRALPKLADLRIALFTQVTEEDVELGLAAGANAVLPKALLGEPLKFLRIVAFLVIHAGDPKRQEPQDWQRHVEKMLQDEPAPGPE